MVWASSEVVTVLAFLLPGFIAAAVFYALTSHPKSGAFDRIVLALILTLVCQTFAELGETALSALVEAEDSTTPTEPNQPVFSIALIGIAVVIGLCLSTISNTDILHRILRWLRVTRETSFPSEWYSTFARNADKAYIVLHLRKGRRLYGYAEEWPSEPKDGHFRIAEAEWLDAENKPTALEGVSAVLVPAAEVTIIEFLPFSDGPKKEN